MKTQSWLHIVIVVLLFAALVAFGLDHLQQQRARTIQGFAGGAATLAAGTCPPNQPNYPTHKEFDPAPARYVLPESNEPKMDDYVLDANGATITYTDLGTLEGHLCPGSDVNWYFTQTIFVKDPFPACWVMKPVTISKCPP